MTPGQHLQKAEKILQSLTTGGSYDATWRLAEATRAAAHISMARALLEHELDSATRKKEAL